ncbi:hypothetical protein HGRIS_005613 [Hohenbuehelia grisea]|uniref:GDP-Man:Man(3)GlcNAc(2)-PP-Dol alpha-1,2-mannosyltransferase n=1 Tax=Hohenbuehelia grisea TaxID=104357 RepID=A0ABR3JY94_9AGAR
MGLLLSSSIWFAYLLISWATLKIYTTRLRSNNIRRRADLLRKLRRTGKEQIIGFFHPYCNAGGGGERVLWTAIAATQRNEPNIVSVIYSGDVDASKEEILGKVKSRFAIDLDPSRLEFVFLENRRYVEDSSWPYFTLLGQSLGSMYLAWEAMTKLIPDLYIDTMGYAFTFQIVGLIAQVPVGAYVHYPTISTEMLARVKSRKRGHTNADRISSSAILSRAKLLYYRVFMYYYALSLRKACFLMVNSSWTKGHIDAILKHNDPLIDLLHYSSLPLLLMFSFGASIQRQTPSSAQIVYPPCDTREMVSFALNGREKVILSVAQFRPEKDHAAQLRSFEKLCSVHPQYKGSTIKLVLVGGCRNEGDEARILSLRALAKELDIQDQVEFVVNAPYPVMLSWLSKAHVGLSTMVDEHFGINVVEFMAAGVIPVTHASGGPLNDIVVPYNGKPTGYHATDAAGFADAIHRVFSLSPEDELSLRSRARAWAVQRFSEDEFERGWNESGWKIWIKSR